MAGLPCTSRRLLATSGQAAHPSTTLLARASAVRGAALTSLFALSGRAARLPPFGVETASKRDSFKQMRLGVAAEDVAVPGRAPGVGGAAEDAAVPGRARGVSGTAEDVAVPGRAPQHGVAGTAIVEQLLREAGVLGEGAARGKPSSNN